MAHPPRIALTPGEPAGIGPDLVLAIAAREQGPIDLVAIADPDLLGQRARTLGLPVEIEPVEEGTPPLPHRAGVLRVLPEALRAPCSPGRPAPANSPYVLATLERAARGCLQGHFQAMVTAPVHKGVINEAGIPFTGHTEFLERLTGSEQSVMLLLSGDLRVALVTTHLPLAEVPAAITRERLERVLRVLDHDLRHRFMIPAPRIAVCGLNPHAGEGGHLGREEVEVIAPVLEELRREGMRLRGPLPADTAFTPPALARCDAVLTMYHDQGLPVLKHLGFGGAVNVTLGLPIIRTSVDHGTALELAGTGEADAGSLLSAIRTAVEMVLNRELDPSSR
ncbi:MAG: 4-hydroxythreonine-4-phosphate dehydrogenase PdxA [Gammaproteobacteria bacterium]|nr:MAG: 4-hydroxythreonine-4-phosphate dehydrogenase PdxA [Gammaproteobacteria bacterium]